MPATTDGNQNYVRHDDDNQPVVPQPTTTAGTVDPGTGWTTQPYLNFNGLYDKHDDNNVDITNPLPNGGDYVRYSDTAGIATAAPLPYTRTP